jgi:hypothetical protein
MKLGAIVRAVGLHSEAAMLTIQDKVELAGLAFGTVFVLVGLFAVIADSLV